MTRQVLGKKKHARCEEIGGRKYHRCFTRGGWKHFEAECLHKRKDGRLDVDWIDYRVGVVTEQEVDRGYY